MKRSTRDRSSVALYARVCTGILACTLAYTLVAPSAHAQARFKWASSKFDVSGYVYSEKCIAMANRVNDSIENRTNEHKHARHWDTYNSYTPYSPAVQAAAAKCAGEKTFQHWTSSAFLRRMAGQHDKFAEIVREHLSRIPAESASTIAASLDTLLFQTLTQRPINLALARPYLDQYFALGKHTRVERRAWMIHRILKITDETKDTVLMQAMLENADKLLQSVNVDTFQAKGLFRPLIVTAFELRHRDTLMNALTESVPAYYKLWGGYLKKASPEMYRESWELTSRNVKQVHATFVYPKETDVTQYPRLGKVTLFVGLPPSSERPERIAIVAAQLHRLKEKFPDLDIILNYRTRGYYGPVEPPTPEQEGKLVDSMWRQFHKVPAIILIEDTKFWRLPAYDRRRINEPTENDLLGEELSLGRFSHGFVYSLFDQNRDAIWIDNTQLPSEMNERERNIEQKIEALLRRKPR